MDQKFKTLLRVNYLQHLYRLHKYPLHLAQQNFPSEGGRKSF